MDNKKCRYCGYEAPVVCDGLGPMMGCEMPGRQPGYKPEPTDTLVRAQINGDSPAITYPDQDCS